jgi:hypothetical protein
MTNKIGIDAFEFYASLGPSRSYQAVADHYGVSKRAVTKKATKENWQKWIIDRERKALEAVDKKAIETLEQMSDRHLKVCKLIQRKALEALRSMPLTTAMEAVKALNLTIKQERLVRGEPTDRTASVEEIIKREYDRWMTTDGDGSDEGDADDQSPTAKAQ